MSAIHSKLRGITNDELDAIANYPDWHRPHSYEPSNLRVIEFEIAIDRIVRYDNQYLRDDTLLHVIFSGSVHVGFETCFQRCAAVSGSFPTDRLRVGFAVCRAAEGKGLEAAYDWPVSYHWLGESLRVEASSAQIDSRSWDDLFVIYRLWSMQKAEQACRRSQD